MSTTASVVPKQRNAGDAFAIGVLVMLVVNVFQRGIGLIRGLGFAHFLSDVELGQWALANSLFIIAVPIAALGMPGSFGKFVEYFRARNQMGSYFTKVACATVAGGVVTCASMLLFSDQFSWLVFGETLPWRIIVWCVFCFGTTIAFSFTTELVAGFRQVKTVSHMQFAQSFGFAAIGLTLVVIYRSWWVLLPSFAMANCFAIIPGWLTLRRRHGEEFSSQGVVPEDSIWLRILPFAASLWAMNLLTNLFDVGSRYMLLHLIEGGQQMGQAVVGQYHCARILPNLLISVGMMLGGILLPYLSADWEAGKRREISLRMQRLIKTVAISFLGLSVAAVVVSPLLFEGVFGGRYRLAEAVLPLALAQAIWIAIFTVSEPFMLCVEKGKQLVGLLTVSLSLNLGLNFVFIQSHGLYGAVAATSVANVLALGLLYWRMNRSGCRIDLGCWVLSVTPIVLVAGPIASMATIVVIVLVAGRTEWLLSQADREQIDFVALEKLERIGLRMRTLWP